MSSLPLDEAREMGESAIQRLNYYVDLNDGKWDAESHKYSPKITVTTRPEKGSAIRLSRAQVNVPSDADAMADHFLNMSEEGMREFDTMLSELQYSLKLTSDHNNENNENNENNNEEKEKEKEKENESNLSLQVLYQRYGMSWPASSRDMLVLRSVKRTYDAQGRRTVFIANQDFPAHHVISGGELDYRRKNTIRVALSISGFRFVTLDEGQCEVSFVLQMDPKGWVPAFLVNRTVDMLPKCLNKMLDATEDHVDYQNKKKKKNTTNEKDQVLD